MGSSMTYKTDMKLHNNRLVGNTLAGDGRLRVFISNLDTITCQGVTNPPVFLYFYFLYNTFVSHMETRIKQA